MKNYEANFSEFITETGERVRFVDYLPTLLPLPRPPVTEQERVALDELRAMALKAGRLHEPKA